VKTGWEVDRYRTYVHGPLGMHVTQSIGLSCTQLLLRFCFGLIV